MSKKPSLYYSTLSPPSRAVLLTANILDVELDLIPINLLTGDHLKPEFVKLNPQHTIPLLNDNGAIIGDSHAICGYLVEKFGKSDSLYPKELVKRAQVNAVLHFDSGVLFSRARFLYEPIIYFGSTELVADKIEYISRAWPILEGYLGVSKYLCGDHLTIADICCEASLCSVDQIVPIDANKYPKLTAWRKRFVNTPNYERDVKDGGAQLQEFVRSKVAA